jgi:hypothetical protein
MLFIVMLLGGSFRERGILDALAISWEIPVMWRILGALGHWMLIFVMCILDKKKRA